MNRIFLCVAMWVAFLSFTPKAQATPITYELLSVASGKIGGTTFTGAVVDLIGTGNTDNVVSFVDPSSSLPFFANPFDTFTVSIGGIGTATITDPSAIWSYAQPIPGFNPIPIVILGRIDAPPALDSFTGIGHVGSDALAGYDLTTGIGPITGGGDIGFNPLCSTGNNDPCVQTSLGLLRFTANGTLNPAGDATFTATATPVPEPATLLLLGSGALVFARRSRTGARK